MFPSQGNTELQLCRIGNQGALDPSGPTWRSRASSRTNSAGLILRTAVKGICRVCGAVPSHMGAHESKTLGRSWGATRGSRGGQPSTSDIPLNVVSHACAPPAAACTANDLQYVQYGQKF